MKNKCRQVILVAFTSIMLSSCCSSIFIAGTGASKSIVTSKKQWFALWGLVRCNKVNPKAMASETNNYKVKTEFTFGDMFTNMFTSILSFQKETITVIK